MSAAARRRAIAKEALLARFADLPPDTQAWLGDDGEWRQRPFGAAEAKPPDEAHSPGLFSESSSRESLTGDPLSAESSGPWSSAWSSGPPASGPPGSGPPVSGALGSRPPSWSSGAPLSEPPAPPPAEPGEEFWPPVDDDAWPLGGSRG